MNARQEIEKSEKKIKEEFYDAYPLCFPEPPRCGFYIGQGWKPLVKKLCADIQAELEKLPENLRNFQVDQVKEKFAGLRFYYSGPVPDDGVIEAEPSEDLIREIAYENWQWRKKFNAGKGSSEDDWYRAEQVAQGKAICNAYPQELKDAIKKIADLVNEAENASFKICDDCGEPGKVRGDGWIRTQCDVCREKENRQRALDERKSIIRRRAGKDIDWQAWLDMPEEKRNVLIKAAEKQLLKEGGIKPVDKY